MQFRLRLVKPTDRAPDKPLAKLTMAEKRLRAIAYLKARNLWVLQKGSRAPKWKA
jgi:hypothetical protein